MNQGTKGQFRVGTLLASAIKLAGTALSFTAAQFNQIMAAFGTVTFDRADKVAIKALTGAALHAANLSWQNPEATAIIITRIVLDRTTKSTGASTIDIGTTAVSATTSSDNLIDGVDSGAAEGVEDNINDAGTNGKARQKLAAGKWVTFDEASGDVTGLVANAYIHYHRI
ncbi:MAG TPA: hypothetical protein VF290_22165 [Pyrinomonadaceae bacterium]